MTIEKVRSKVAEAAPQLITIILRDAVERRSPSSARWLIGWSGEGRSAAPPPDAPLTVFDEMDELYAQRVERGDGRWFPDTANGDEPLDELAARRRSAGLA